MATVKLVETEGPFLGAAFFCERVLEEKDGVITPVRIVDRIVTSASGTGTPDEMPPTAVNLTLLVVLKSGAAQGRHDLTVTVEDPAGLRNGLIGPLTVTMEGSDRGSNLIFRLAWTATHEGLYWFDINVNDSRLTRVPLRLVYQRQETGGRPPG